jgi:hypothetical protein
MTSPAEKLLPLKVFGTVVPCRRVRVRGGMRDHEHIYPHSPGAGVELLGRDLYKIEVSPIFDANLLPDKYKGIWPAGLKKLRDLFDVGTRSEVSIPTVGIIRAYCKTWEQEFDATRCLSGEDVTWHFTEDSENLRLSSQTINLGQGLSNASLTLQATLSASPLKKTNLWDQIFRAIDAVMAYRDQYELYASLIESKLLAILSLLEQIDNAADELQDPSSWAIIEAMHQVWTQTRAFYQDQKQLGLVSVWYKTKQVMSCMQLAVILFDDSSKSSELLQMNGFTDPFAIPAGTNVKYYKIQQQAA